MRGWKPAGTGDRGGTEGVSALRVRCISVCLQLFFCYLVAYGLSMYDFKLRNPLFFIVIATMMVPGVQVFLHNEELMLSAPEVP